MNIEKIELNSINSFIVKDNDIHKYQDDIYELYNNSKYSHYTQSVDWFSCDNHNREQFFVLTYSGQTLVCFSLMSVRQYKIINKAKYFISRGPVINNIQYIRRHLEDIIKLVRENGIFLRLSTYIYGVDYNYCKTVIESCNFFKTQSSSSPYDSTIILELTSSLESIRRSFRRSLKTQINRASKQSILVEENTSYNDFVKFIKLLNSFGRMKGFGEIDEKLASCLFRRMKNNPKLGSIFIAKYQDEIVAGIVILVTGNRAIYSWGYSSQEIAHKNMPLSHLLHWRGINWAKNMNLKYYDFGGYWEELGDNDPINRFKTGFSKEIQSFVSEYTFYLSQFLGRLFIFLEKVRKILK